MEITPLWGWIRLFCLVCFWGVLGSLPSVGATDFNALVNLSVNARVPPVGITPGFIVQAEGGDFVILGESQYTTGEPLPDPWLQVRNLQTGQVLGENDNWRNHPNAQGVVASLRAPATETDAALALSLPPGAYVVELRDRQGGAGQALLSIQQVASIDPVTEAQGVPCLALDAQDGAVARVPYPYTDWRCEDIQITDNEGGHFDIRLRWNRPGLASRASLVWLAGGDGRQSHGEFEQGVVGAADSRSLRTRLAEDAAIRSVEIQFLNHPPGQPVLADVPGLWGYWSAPQAGYPRVARVYRMVLERLHQAPMNLLSGDWTTLVGSSNGATVVGFALAYENIDGLVDRAVFISGPFLADVGRECRDPGYPAYMGVNDGRAGQIPGDTIRGLVSAWNGWQDCRNPGLDLWGRSLLDPGAQRDFPELDVAVLMGETDIYGAWILASNQLWFQAIEAQSKSRVVVSALGHEPWGISRASQELLYQQLRRPPS